MIDEIANELESLPNKKAAIKFSERFAKTQRQLIEFLFATLEECSSEAQETGFFIALVAWTYYSRTKKLRSVTEKSIMQKFELATDEMQSYEEGDESALTRLLPDDIQDDEVLTFVTMEIEAARQDNEITADEAGTLFVTLKVVVDCLAESVENPKLTGKDKWHQEHK